MLKGSAPSKHDNSSQSIPIHKGSFYNELVTSMLSKGSDPVGMPKESILEQVKRLFKFEEQYLKGRESLDCDSIRNPEKG